jgi:hypothetical protein
MTSPCLSIVSLLAILFGVAIAGVLSTPVGVRTQAIKELQTPFTPFVPKARDHCYGSRDMSKVWLITGAGRAMGVDIAKAALSAGHKVVATGRNTGKVSAAVGKSVDLFVVKLDVTKPTDAESAVKASVDKFGHIDVLVNNAANFYAGFFEELSPEQIERQLSTSLIGPMNVTRAVLPIMRKQRSGLIITISSTAGLMGLNSVPPTLRPSSALRAGCSRCRPRSTRLDRYHHCQSRLLSCMSLGGRSPTPPSRSLLREMRFAVPRHAGAPSITARLRHRARRTSTRRRDCGIWTMPSE